MWDLATLEHKNLEAAGRAWRGVNETTGLPRTIKSSPEPRTIKVEPSKQPACEQCQNA